MLVMLLLKKGLRDAFSGKEERRNIGNWWDLSDDLSLEKGQKSVGVLERECGRVRERERERESHTWPNLWFTEKDISKISIQLIGS